MTSKNRLYEIASHKRGWQVIEELPDHYDDSTSFYCKDNNGYIYKTSARNLYNKKGSPMCHKSNKYSIHNIQNFLNINNLQFEIIDTEYISNKQILHFKCKRCETIVETKWININRLHGENVGRLLCPKCDGTVESYHAVALKQMFMHEYPDTIVEERSCVNPKTNHIMPTDIVNHRLKIAIEIQSQWHDYRQEKDKIKKEFWINKGYSFYAPDIRDYSILEICQLFFDIDELPNYIDFTQANKINIHKIQTMLDDNMSPKEIAKILKISDHRIYDALYNKKLHYPDNYTPKCNTSVVQFDTELKIVSFYDSIIDASLSSGVPKGNISACLYNKRNYSGGYYWQTLKDYENNIPIKRYKNP